MEEQNGIVYYSLRSGYEGDVTKNCGLSTSEIDGNFFFLRGKNMMAVNLDEEHSELVMVNVDGTVISTEGFGDFVASIAESHGGSLLGRVVALEQFAEDNSSTDMSDVEIGSWFDFESDSDMVVNVLPNVSDQTVDDEEDGN